MTEPTEKGWYRTVDPSNWMVYSLNNFGEWRAHMMNGDTVRCHFSYVDQGGPIELIAGYPNG